MADWGRGPAGRQPSAWGAASPVGGILLNGAGWSAGSGTNAKTRAIDPAAFDLAYWETIKNSTDPEDFKAYLEQFPSGRFAALARRRAQPVASAANSAPGTTVSARPDAADSRPVDR